MKCPHCTTPLETVGITTSGTIYVCPQCKGEFEIKVSRKPREVQP